MRSNAGDSAADDQPAAASMAITVKQEAIRIKITAMVGGERHPIRSYADSFMRSAERLCREFFSALFADSRTLVDVQSISQGENVRRCATHLEAQSNARRGLFLWRRRNVTLPTISYEELLVIGESSFAKLSQASRGSNMIDNDV